MQHETHHEEAVEKTSGIPIIGVAIILAILAIFLLSYFKNDATGANKGNIWDLKNGTVHTGEMKEESEAHEEVAPAAKSDSTGAVKVDSIGKSATTIKVDSLGKSDSTSGAK
jgi:hypothetical protein